MGRPMAPATDAIMGSLPAAKVSVGSAVNDTTRTTGGALGVAVLGSLLASGYRGDMDAATSTLPDPARAAAQDSLAGALAVAGRIGGARRRPAARRRRAGVHVRHAHRRARRRASSPSAARSSRSPSCRPARARSPCRRDRAQPDHAAAGPAALGGGGRGDHARDARPARRGRLPRADDGARCASAPAWARRRSTAATPPRRSSCAAAIAHLNADIPLPDDTGSLEGDFVATSPTVLAGAESTGAFTLMPRLLAEVVDDAGAARAVLAHLVEPRRRVVARDRPARHRPRRGARRRRPRPGGRPDRRPDDLPAHRGRRRSLPKLGDPAAVVRDAGRRPQASLTCDAAAGPDAEPAPAGQQLEQLGADELAPPALQRAHAGGSG